MGTIARIAVAARKFLVAIAALFCVVVIFWGILYKLFLPFTPLWVDVATIIAVAIALLLGLTIGRGSPSPYSRSGEQKP